MEKKGKGSRSRQGNPSDYKAGLTPAKGEGEEGGLGQEEPWTDSEEVSPSLTKSSSSKIVHKTVPPLADITRS